VNSAFYGLRPASTGLIAAAGFTVVASNLFFSDVWVQGNYLGAFNWKGIVLAAVLWILTNVLKPTKKWHPIVFIGFSALIGIIFKMA
jgi:chromate transporter